MLCCLIYPDGRREEVEADPVCCEDFCEDCGDCLHCDGGDPCWCSKDREHRWFKYVNEDEVENHGT